MRGFSPPFSVIPIPLSLAPRHRRIFFQPSCHGKRAGGRLAYRRLAQRRPPSGPRRSVKAVRPGGVAPGKAGCEGVKMMRTRGKKWRSWKRKERAEAICLRQEANRFGLTGETKEQSEGKRQGRNENDSMISSLPRYSLAGVGGTREGRLIIMLHAGMDMHILRRRLQEETKGGNEGKGRKEGKGREGKGREEKKGRTRPKIELQELRTSPVRRKYGKRAGSCGVRCLIVQIFAFL